MSNCSKLDTFLSECPQTCDIAFMVCLDVVQSAWPVELYDDHLVLTRQKTHVSYASVYSRVNYSQLLA